MENLKIGFLLHFYQPWWQFPHVLKEIVNRCYYPILKLVEETPGFCFSANINYSLLELLNRDYTETLDGFILDHDFHYVISRFKKAVEEKKIELLGSTVYHPILPLIPKNIQIVEMAADTQFKRMLWGIEKNCGGIFLPEMAFSRSIVPNLQSCGYKWTLADDEPFRVQCGYVPFDRIPAIDGFQIFLRSNLWSNLIAQGKLFNFEFMRRRMEREIPDWTKNQPAYLILALDAETFSWHCKDLIGNLLEPLIKEWGSSGQQILIPFEEIINKFEPWNLCSMISGSWATSEEDIRNGDFYPLWKLKSNIHHQNLWRLVEMALKYAETPGANWDCMKIVSSCHWWWISRRPEWRPEFMKFGARKAFEIIRQYGTPEEIAEAKKIFEKLDSLK